MDPILFQNSDEGRKAFVDLASRAVQWISAYYSNIENYPVRSQIQPGDIYKQFPNEPASLPVSDGYRSSRDSRRSLSSLPPV